MSKEALAEQPAQQEPRIDIYRSFEQWKSGNVLEHGVPRTEHYSEAQLDLVEMGWNYGYDAGRAVEQALDKKAENAREMWLDYEPDGMHHNKPQKRPQNCGTGYCSCIECVMEPAQQEPVAYLCENAVGHKYFRWKKPSSTYKPIALYTTPPAQLAVPDAIGPNEDELPSYAAGWNDCRALMLEMRKP